MKIVLLISFIFLINVCQTQESWYPTKKEINNLDSIIMARFQESSCYNAEESYSINHIFIYDYFKDTLKRSDFIDKSLLSKIKKQYYPYKYCYPQIDSVKKVEKQVDSIFYMRDENYDVIIKDVLGVYKSFIYDRLGNVVALWATDDEWILCTKYYSFKDGYPLFKLLKSDEFKIIFHLASSAGGNLIGKEKNGNLIILVYPFIDESGVIKISIEELVNEYWHKFDVFKR